MTAQATALGRPDPEIINRIYAALDAEYDATRQVLEPAKGAARVLAALEQNDGLVSDAEYLAVFGALQQAKDTNVALQEERYELIGRAVHWRNDPERAEQYRAAGTRLAAIEAELARNYARMSPLAALHISLYEQRVGRMS